MKIGSAGNGHIIAVNISNGPIVTTVGITVAIENLIISVNISGHLAERTRIAPKCPTAFSKLSTSGSGGALLDLVVLHNVHAD